MRDMRMARIGAYLANQEQVLTRLGVVTTVWPLRIIPKSGAWRLARGAKIPAARMASQQALGALSQFGGQRRCTAGVGRQRWSALMRLAGANAANNISAARGAG
jgi:hypothetical protein